MTYVLKKDGKLQEWQPDKIKRAIAISADRAHSPLTSEQKNLVVAKVENFLRDKESVSVYELHGLVLEALYEVSHPVYIEYKAYRNYKDKFQKSFANTYEFARKIRNAGDNENANKDSQLNSTKQALIAEGIMKELMFSFEMKPAWVKAHQEGWVHIHDAGSRFINSHNCNLFRLGNVMKDGFELNGTSYYEPGGVQKAFDVGADLVLSASAQQYGGFTVPEIDKIMAPYAEKTFEKAFKYFRQEIVEKEVARKLAYNQTIREIEQGTQAFETKLNTISNSLGQTPFVTTTFGLDTSKWGREISKAMLNTRIEGLGKKKTTAIFPKLVFLHRNEVNGAPTSPNYDLKQLGIQCSRKRLYPDFLSLDEGYLAEAYEKGGVVSPMGCRAFLGEFYEDGKLIYEGRANIGAVTLNLPKYALEAKKAGDNKVFFELIDKYSEMVFDIHEETYARVGKSKGSTNPLFYCEGGAWKSVGYDEEIAPIVEGFTASLGFIGLEEVCQAMYGTSLEESNAWATRVVEYLWGKVVDAKEKFNHLYTLYATPAESLIERFQNFNKKDYGIIEGVTDKAYMTNSFHQHVTIKHNPLQKMLLEKPMFDISVGGRIQYCEYPYNVDEKALEQCVSHAMSLGLYHGINIESSTCQDCGEQGEFHICPKCGSEEVTVVNRCCGYLSYDKVKGKSRYNEAKKAEIKDRVDHM